MTQDRTISITLKDYHEWLGELYAQVRQLQLALAEADKALAAQSVKEDCHDSDSPVDS